MDGGGKWVSRYCINVCVVVINLLFLMVCIKEREEGREGRKGMGYSRMGWDTGWEVQDRYG